MGLCPPITQSKILQDRLPKDHSNAHSLQVPCWGALALGVGGLSVGDGGRCGVAMLDGLCRFPGACLRRMGALPALVCVRSVPVLLLSICNYHAGFLTGLLLDPCGSKTALAFLISRLVLAGLPSSRALTCC